MTITQDPRPVTVMPASTASTPAAAHSSLSDPISPAGHHDHDTHGVTARGGQNPPATRRAAHPKVASSPADYHLLAFAASAVDDLEDARVAAGNRLRQIIRTVADKDGRERGFGLLPPGVCAEDDKLAVQKVITAAAEFKRAPAFWHPAVWQLAAITGQVAGAEKAAIRHLEKQVAGLALGPWVASMCGVGAKQAGRLLGAIGDPYIRPAIEHEDAPCEPSRPRTLGDLYSYCGHGDAARRPVRGMTQAAAKQLGNPEARKRVRIIAMQVIKFTGGGIPRSPYRDVYDEARERYAAATHATECLNRSRVHPNGCGIRAHPEWGAPGSPWRDGHQHASALRLVGKAFLADLWREAKRIHETCASGQVSRAPQSRAAAGALDEGAA